jgi:hypothetical protein
MQDRGVIHITVRGIFLFSKFRRAPEEIYHQIRAVSGKSVAQSVRLRTGLHIPLPASLATLYGVLLNQMVK